jgi:hypothetical protein
MSHLIEQYLIDAVATVSTWELDDEAVPDAVNAQARLMAGLDFQETIFEPADRPAHIIQ